MLAVMTATPAVLAGTTTRAEESDWGRRIREIIRDRRSNPAAITAIPFPVQYQAVEFKS